VKKEKITFIGHSMGSLLSLELSKSYPSSKLIALEPPADKKEPSNYSKNIQGDEITSFNNKGICYRAKNSSAGSNSLALSCNKSILVDYQD
jgi:esterase/lipase